MFKHSDK
jgi:hypothetical protein